MRHSTKKASFTALFAPEHSVLPGLMAGATASLPGLVTGASALLGWYSASEFLRIAAVKSGGIAGALGTLGGIAGALGGIAGTRETSGACVDVVGGDIVASVSED